MPVPRARPAAIRGALLAALALPAAPLHAHPHALEELLALPLARLLELRVVSATAVPSPASRAVPAARNSA